ncbi:hypothetical protein NLX85_21985 [Micromonospora sp. A3M-1-15]|uniref:hypothetical protein n=1 Tax=Micromonospora sp. A3M-1-15 TaxID=2962035 RepID=UPI0020B6BB32|nr:hypothetical protein [Micromonospora sp. A3M-1-15]MCP3786038.1 hypothetical protein [Micromonospora sp. A3M-1-15]
MYNQKSAIEQLLNNYAQIERIEALAQTFEPAPIERPSAPRRWPSTAVLNDFCRTVATILSAWGIPQDGPVLIDQEAEDLVIDGKPRASRGKGMRSILHAAFTLGLAEYCIERELQHPGFVVLDSPLVTYREPDSVVEDVAEGEEFVTPNVVSAFYRYVDTEFDGQAIIIENTTPPSELSETADVLFFTKLADFGRYGFFPLKGGGNGD